MVKIFTSRRCLAHRAPGGFPERPERLQAILDRLAGSDAFPGALVEDAESLVGEADAAAAIRAVHDEAYVERLARAVARGDGLIDSADNPLSPGTWDAATAAVAASLAAARWVLGASPEGAAGAGSADEGGRHAFVAARPPGHHAERARAMGFCYFNNVAVAVEDLLRSGLIERAAILDFDVHHGNGTQHLFEDRSDVFYASLHQWPFYPGTGAGDERGRGAGAGTTLNVPLPAGTGDDDFLGAVDEVVLPALEHFGPDLLAVSAGFDAWRGDPLGGMRLSEEAFRELGRRVARLAAGRSRGRSLSLLEGGYDLSALPRLVEAYLEGLSTN